MIYVLAFLSMTVLDVAWVGYNRSTAQGNRGHARLWAVLLVVLGGLNTFAIVETPWALIATAAGAFFGTDLGLRLSARLERDVPPVEIAGPVELSAVPDRRLALELALADVATEMISARSKFAPFNSAHEGFAVALEEVDELWDIVKCKQRDRDLDKMRREAIQAAAMFCAFAAECCGEKTGRV